MLGIQTLLLTMMLNTWNMRQFNKFKRLMTNEKTFLHRCSRKEKHQSKFMIAQKKKEKKCTFETVQQDNISWTVSVPN